jgi:hypothetical protein
MEATDDLASALERVKLHQPNADGTSLNDLPDDIVELILKPLSEIDGWGNGLGGLTSCRLACRRMLRVVEGCAKHITFQNMYGVDSLPVNSLKRCRRITHIMVGSTNLHSLEGVPPTLESILLIGMRYSQMFLMEGGPAQSLGPLAACPQLEFIQLNDGSAINDLSPLASCKKMKSLTIHYSKITDISAVASMPLLENLAIPKDYGHKYRYIEDLSPLLACKRLGRANLNGNEIKNKSALEELNRRPGLNLILNHG